VGDLVGQPLAHLARLEHARGVGRVRVVDRVEQRHLVARGVRERPQLVERDDRRVRDLKERVLELVDRHVERRGHLRVGGRAPELACSSRAFTRSDLARAGAHRARHPVERAQLVDDRTLMRVMAKVSNLISRSGSKRSTAEISPTSP